MRTSPDKKCLFKIPGAEYLQSPSSTDPGKESGFNRITPKQTERQKRILSLTGRNLHRAQ
jgi:hypothetical protein